jgi:hypothetical protein
MGLQDNPAWKCLNLDEQTAITLKHISGKSSWEIGEIMGKAHYKMLEILQRGEVLMKLFTNYYKYEENFPPTDLAIDKPLYEYLQGCIVGRNMPGSVIKGIDNPVFQKPLSRDKMINKAIEVWVKSSNQRLVLLSHTILEFDRWNNYRILPESIQEPSGFKRRNKNAEKKRIASWVEIDKTILYHLEEELSIQEDHAYKGMGFCVLFQGSFSLGKIKRFTINDHTIKVLSSYKIYLFPENKPTELFKELVEEYFSNGSNTPRIGQDFWKKYRDLVELAINYKEVQGIKPEREQITPSLNHSTQSRGYSNK